MSEDARMPNAGPWPVTPGSDEYEAMRADALQRVAKGLDLPEGFTVGFDRTPLRVYADGSVDGYVHPWPAHRVTPSGYRVDSAAHRRRRIALRRNVYRCRTSALLMATVMAGAFAADRPVAGVLASALVFMLLRCAAEARAEL